MQAKAKNMLRLAVDACLTVLLLCLMAYQVTGEALHEWIGMGMTAVLILHHVLNARWYGALFKGKYNAFRIISTVVNTLLLASIALTALCGMSGSASGSASPGHDGEGHPEPLRPGAAYLRVHAPRRRRPRFLPL